MVVLTWLCSPQLRPSASPPW